MSGWDENSNSIPRGNEGKWLFTADKADKRSKLKWITGVINFL